MYYIVVAFSWKMQTENAISGTIITTVHWVVSISLMNECIFHHHHPVRYSQHNDPSNKCLACQIDRYFYTDNYTDWAYYLQIPIVGYRDQSIKKLKKKLYIYYSIRMIN